MMRKDTWRFSVPPHSPHIFLLGDCNAILLRRNATQCECSAMGLQRNAIATRCNPIAMPMRLQCDGAVAIGRLLQCDCNATPCDCNATQCDGTVWPSSSFVLCLSQSSREEGRRRARRGGGEVVSPSWARGPRRREEEGCHCNAMRL